ncbi:MAG: hypothetical protein DU429_04025 [Candidatus Tokpelaia sp.]|nr:MAG: hypothetical protein DU430_06350 [Candidatus Tokpelaia sp.]KAA6207025.1 MAG: hypothetical protein DU429_04025 [Candidatus Tokpelaia sp.]KAA6405436.1 hypothetical protein DPQ22_05120 [Candidatus Tokpelaia sp.]
MVAGGRDSSAPIEQYSDKSGAGSSCFGRTYRCFLLKGRGRKIAALRRRSGAFLLNIFYLFISHLLADLAAAFAAFSCF